MTKDLRKDLILHCANEIEGENREKIRRDMGWPIIYCDECEKVSKYGWCITAYSKCGTDNFLALLSFLHKNVQSKCDNFSYYTMVVRSQFGLNIGCRQLWNYLRKIS